MEIVRRALRERRYSGRTEEAYVHWIRRFIVANGRRHPAELGADEVRRFLSALAVDERVSASTQNQARLALTFLYAHVVRRPLEPVEGVMESSGCGGVLTRLSGEKLGEQSARSRASASGPNPASVKPHISIVGRRG